MADVDMSRPAVAAESPVLEKPKEFGNSAAAHPTATPATDAACDGYTPAVDSAAGSPETAEDGASGHGEAAAERDDDMSDTGSVADAKKYTWKNSNNLRDRCPPRNRSLPEQDADSAPADDDPNAERLAEISCIYDETKYPQEWNDAERWRRQEEDNESEPECTPQELVDRGLTQIGSTGDAEADEDTPSADEDLPDPDPVDVDDRTALANEKKRRERSGGVKGDVLEARYAKLERLLKHLAEPDPNAKPDKDDDANDFELFADFMQEWLEEKDLYQKGQINSRPLDKLVAIIAGPYHEIGNANSGEKGGALGGPIGSAANENVREALREMDGVLTQRCKSLEIVRQRDVREEEKSWVCEPCLYLPPRDEWIDLKKHPECSELLTAVRSGSPQDIHEAVEAVGGTDISLIRDHRGRCVMHYAAQNGNVAALEYFGPLANAVDCEGWAPLHYAAYFGNRITCDRLVQLGADINMLDAPYGKSAFDYAKDGQMKCTMISLALNGSQEPEAKALAQRYIDSLSGRKKTMNFTSM